MKNEISGPILVTGASGFIGANLVRRLIKDGYDTHLILRNESKTWRLDDILEKVTVHRSDLTNYESVVDVVSKIKPKTIFHLAAYGAYSSQKEVDRIKAVILDGTINLLTACETIGFESFINTGSSSEYGFKQKPMKETDVLEPNSHYAVFKAAATNFCQYEAISKKLPIITLRPFSVYGPYEEPTRLVPTLITKFLKNDCPPLVAPETARDYIYVDDVIDLYLLAAKNSQLGGEVLNMGTGEQITLKQIVDTAIELTGAKVEPQWGTMEQRIWDQNIWQADISKVKSMTGWQPKHDLTSGLSKTITWLKDNIDLYKIND
jgi:nucleoside-diphosphate-sugar epimerase